MIWTVLDSGMGTWQCKNISSVPGFWDYHSEAYIHLLSKIYMYLIWCAHVVANSLHLLNMSITCCTYSWYCYTNNIWTWNEYQNLINRETIVQIWNAKVPHHHLLLIFMICGQKNSSFSAKLGKINVSRVITSSCHCINLDSCSICIISDSWAAEDL